jgi:hypothetical protein
MVTLYASREGKLVKIQRGPATVKEENSSEKPLFVFTGRQIGFDDSKPGYLP